MWLKSLRRAWLVSEEMRIFRPNLFMGRATRGKSTAQPRAICQSTMIITPMKTTKEKPFWQMSARHLPEGFLLRGLHRRNDHGRLADGPGLRGALASGGSA